MLWDMRHIQRMGAVSSSLQKTGRYVICPPYPPGGEWRDLLYCACIFCHAKNHRVVRREAFPFLFLALPTHERPDVPHGSITFRDKTGPAAALLQLMAKATRLLAYHKHVKPLPIRATELLLCQRDWTRSNLSTRGETRY
ncbi:unnamed protein product [Musa textilis]